jgi:hypothetical protein
MFVMKAPPLSVNQRVILFLFGCVGARVGIAYISSIASTRVLSALAVVAATIAIGFSILFLFGLRKTGIETGGKPIWWNNLRPIHAVMYGLFAYFAWNNRGDVAAWILLMDVAIGLFAFIVHHTRSA